MLIMTSPAIETEHHPAPNTSAVISPLSSPTLSASKHISTAATEPQHILARRQFPAVVFLLHHSMPDTLPSVRGVFMSLSNANQECRRLRTLDAPHAVKMETPDETEARVRDERKRDIGRELERWQTAEGIECWVEVHEVVPRRWVDRGSVSSLTHPPRKLYENEEEDDEIEEDEEYAGHQN